MPCYNSILDELRDNFKATAPGRRERAYDWTKKLNDLMSSQSLFGTDSAHAKDRITQNLTTRELRQEDTFAW